MLTQIPRSRLFKMMLDSFYISKANIIKQRVNSEGQSFKKASYRRPLIRLPFRLLSMLYSVYSGLFINKARRRLDYR